MDAWSRSAAVALGGGLGSLLRFWLGQWIAPRLGPGFPWATLIINVSGSLAIGALATIIEARRPHPSVGLALTVGALGGYTTFSTFSIETLRLWHQSRGAAAAYVAASLIGGLAAVAAGVAIARRWLGTD